jgi:hypothetical protein
VYEAALRLPEFGRSDFRHGDYLESAFKYSKWVKEKWKKPKPSLSGGFSLLNFLFEWKETLRLASDWLTRKGLLKRFHELIAHNDRTLTGAARAAANERLMHVYGTRLFLQDAKTMFTLMYTWKDRADRFLADAGTIKRVYKEPLHRTISHGSLGGTQNLPVFGVPDSTVHLERELQLDAHASLAYKYSVAELRGFIARLAQVSDSYGVKLDAGIVWDAIPFSFTVDWFINVSEWLHNNAAMDWNKVEVKILDYCVSGSLRSQSRLYWQRYRPAFFASDLFFASKAIAEHHVSIYDRKSLEVPDFSRVDIELNGDPWRIDRVINATALMAQRALSERHTRKIFDYRNIQGVIRRAKRIAETRQFLSGH